MCPATTTAAPPRLRTAGRLLVVGGALLTMTTHQAQAQARVAFWATLGVGAEIPVGVNLSVGPMVTYAYSDMPAKPDFGIGEYGWTASVWEFGAAITMHR